MNYKIIDCEQRSPEWYSSRRGVPTASEFDKIVTMKGELSKQRTKYMYQLAGELLGAIPEEGYTNAAMLRGIELESTAREMYSTMVAPAVPCGFFLTEFGYGASPDGLVGDDGEVEIKCPSLATHVEYLYKRELPSDYFQQVHGQLLVTGRKYNDFVSFYPGVKPLIVRVRRDEKFIESLHNELVKFIAELNTLVETLKKEN